MHLIFSHRFWGSSVKHTLYGRDQVSRGVRHTLSGVGHTAWGVRNLKLRAGRRARSTTCSRSLFRDASAAETRTYREANIDLYYTSRLIKSIFPTRVD